MSGLRETKKQATRQALADAAVRIVLTEGYDALSVAAVAAAAGVSPRTFHNYFGNLDDALMDFVRTTFAILAEDVRALPKDMNILDIFEELAERGFNEEGFELHSVASLFAMGELIENQRIRPTEGEPKDMAEQIAEPIFRAFADRLPDRDEFEVNVILQATASAVIHAVRVFQHRVDAGEAVNPDEGRALVRRAVDVLRDFPTRTRSA